MRFPFQTVVAAVTSVILGWITAAITVDSMFAGPFLLLLAAIINPIIVCFLARCCLIIIGLLPMLTAEFTLYVIAYADARYYDGADLPAFLRSHAKDLPPLIGL